MLLDADGTLIGVVDASLVSPRSGDADGRWFGTVTGEFDAFDLMEGTPSIRLPDGREAMFRPSRSDLVVPRMGVDIVGTGPPPF